jgi:hypothetical protein
MRYDLKTFTYGFEMEMGDVPRYAIIPEHLGEWEYSECDIVNTRGIHRGVCADPAGKSPPFGGEVNTKPTLGWQKQVDRILEIKDYFTMIGYEPTSPFTTHNHCHVHVPGLMEDPEALKRLAKYIKENQKDFVDLAYPFHEVMGMDQVPAARTYLKLDGGRLFPDWRLQNMIDHTTDFQSFIKLHYAGKDAVSLGRPIRTAINTYCMKHVKTIEFRCFRGSFERKHLESCFFAIELFMAAALNNGPSWRGIYNTWRDQLEFPPMQFDLELAKGWIATKHKAEDTSGKNRKFYEAS